MRHRFQLRSSGLVGLFPDCDAEGVAGFKELLWQLNEQSLAVRLA
ncbi:MAG: hypothetical protein R3C01_17105 [Planctomycetaceae bacterium]